MFDEDAVRPLAQEAVIKIGKGAVPALLVKLKAMVKNAQTSNGKARMACIICLRDINHATDEVGAVLGLAAQFDLIPENRTAATQAGNKLFQANVGGNPAGGAGGGN